MAGPWRWINGLWLWQIKVADQPFELIPLPLLPRADRVVCFDLGQVEAGEDLTHL
jgi:hypothetical protein